MESGQFTGTFPIATDSLPKLKSYIASLLKRQQYQVEHSETSEGKFLIVAAKGNKFLHYIAEMILEHVPLAGLFGWAVRVQMTFAIVGQNSNGHYMLKVISEPACNDIMPFSSFFEDDPKDVLEEAGEDGKCRDAFQHFTGALIKSSYLAKPMAKPNA